MKTHSFSLVCIFLFCFAEYLRVYIREFSLRVEIIFRIKVLEESRQHLYLFISKRAISLVTVANTNGGIFGFSYQ